MTSINNESVSTTTPYEGLLGLQYREMSEVIGEVAEVVGEVALVPAIAPSMEDFPAGRPAFDYLNN